MFKLLGIFADKVDDGYGGYTYEFTDWGYTALVVIAIGCLIIGASIFGKKHQWSTKQMAFSSMAMALGLLTSFAKLYSFPMGGSITLFSMLFIALVGYWYGGGTGITVAVAYGILQMLIDPYVISIPQMLIDYIFAFGALGLSGFLKNNKYGIIPAYILAVLGRYVFAFLSGWIFFSEYASDWGFESGALYSLAYNGIYLGAECGVTVALLLIPSVRNALNKIKADAVS